MKSIRQVLVFTFVHLHPFNLYGQDQDQTVIMKLLHQISESYERCLQNVIYCQHRNFLEVKCH